VKAFTLLAILAALALGAVCALTQPQPEPAPTHTASPAPPRPQAPVVRAYAKEVSAGGQRRKVQVVEAELSTVALRVGVGSGRIGLTEDLAGIAKRGSAIAAINGCYFDAYAKSPPYYPDFAMISGGRLLWQSTLGVMLGYVPDEPLRIGRPPLAPAGTVGADGTWRAFAVNRYRGGQGVVVFTPEYLQPTTPPGGTCVIVADGQVQAVAPSPQTIPVTGFVIEYFGAEPPAQFSPGQPCTLSHRAAGDASDGDGFWDRVTEGLACGPTLVRDGQVAVDPQSEGFRDPKVLTSAGQRSGVGTTADGRIVLVACPSVTVRQFAAAMQALGCTEAMGLDGGASSGLWCQGRYLVQPGRRISNALLIVRRP